VASVSARRFALGVSVAAVITAVAGAGVGCGSSGSGGSTKAKSIKPTHPTQLPPGGLGSYVRAGVPKGDSTALNLTRDGRYSQSFAGQPFAIRGVWRYRSGKMTFAETSGKGAACIGKFGSYSWRFRRGQLRLRSLGDPCKPRSGDFEFAPWRRSG
jgi:hypothetical protein